MPAPGPRGAGGRQPSPPARPPPTPDIPEASLLEDEDDDPIPPSTTTTIATSEQSTGSYGDNSSPDTASPSLSPGFEDLSPAALNGRRSPTEDGETPPPRPGQ